MYRFKKFLFVLLISAAASPVYAQTKAERQTIRQLQQDAGYLASDELEGRATGSEGERKAADYIIKRYKQERILPYQGTYKHPFNFVKGREINTTTQIRIGENTLRIPEDAFPLAFTGSGKATGAVLPDVMEQGSIWLVPLYQNETEAQDPHFDWEKYTYDKTREAAKLGAQGILFYDSYQAKYPPAFNTRSDYEKTDIPAAILHYDAWQRLVNNTGNAANQTGIHIELNPAVNKTEGTGHNVTGYIDNQAPYTVVIGAHYDHLGYGLDGSSLHSGERQIHNGADDNASGSALLLHLATQIKKSKLRNYNYLFIHFSGEEMGLLGSKAIVRDLQLDSNRIAYMINMDMVGRLNDSTHALTIGGIGTSPAWHMIGKHDYFRIRTDSSGVGPSDHSSFYHAGVPVLFFFTGTHKDYHKPGDDAHLLNYPGMAQIGGYIFNIVKRMDQEAKPAFTPTRQVSTGRTRFKVTLGIIPDYSFQEGGVRVDGVSENKPAAAAGVQAGDVIIGLGSHTINGMQSYMEALGAFNPGDATEVTIRRGTEEKTLPLIFSKP